MIKFLAKFSNAKLLVLFLIFLNSGLTDQPAEKNNFYQLKNEYENFLSKYKTNSCIMQVFSKIRNNCSNLSDSQNSEISFKMTLCLYSSLNKEIYLKCDRNNYIDCVKLLDGDLWTTYITFTHHVDNLCFYFNTLLWEKSSEFLFSKLLNSSLDIINELNESKHLAQQLYKSQEKFSSQIELNLNETMVNFQKLNLFFENYTQIEEKLKENINVLENKINNNNDKMEDIIKYIDEKIDIIKIIYEFFNNYQFNSLGFFVILTLIILISTHFKALEKSKFTLYSCLIIFFAIEKLIITQINLNLFDLTFIYFNLIFYTCRILYFTFILSFIIMKAVYYTKANPSKQFSDNSYSDYKNFINMTPVWMKRYFNKIRMQNEYLIDKFNKMRQLMDKEENFKNVKRDSFYLYSE